MRSESQDFINTDAVNDADVRHIEIWVQIKYCQSKMKQKMEIKISFKRINKDENDLHIYSLLPNKILNNKNVIYQENIID